MRSWLASPKNKPKEVVAIDIGTASVSAALARVSGHGPIEIASIVRYPFDLFNDSARIDKQKRMLYVLSTALSKMFADMRKISSPDCSIRISFSDPFFEERDSIVVVSRSDPKKNITQEEVNAALKSDAKKIDEGAYDKALWSSLGTIRHEVVEYKINGYHVEDAIGYRGNTMEIKVRELGISKTLQDTILEQKDRFFPKNTLEYYSDPDILKRAILAKKISPMPMAVFDIGGEVTSLFIIKNSLFAQRCAPVFFGLRTLERRIATFLRIDGAHAETVLKQYADGVLDDKTLAGKIDLIVQGFLEDWYAKVGASLKEAGVRHEIAKALVVGSGREIKSFMEYIDTHAKEFFEEESTVCEGTFVDAFFVATDSFLPVKSLSQGGDAVLASLILYADYEDTKIPKKLL